MQTVTNREFPALISTPKDEECAERWHRTASRGALITSRGRRLQPRRQQQQGQRERFQRSTCSRSKTTSRSCCPLEEYPYSPSRCYLSIRSSQVLHCIVHVFKIICRFSQVSDRNPPQTTSERKSCPGDPTNLDNTIILSHNRCPPRICRIPYHP